MVHIFHSISHALPSVQAKDRSTRIAVLHVGGLAPGMNAAVHAAVRLGLYRGHTMLGVAGSFRGLIDGEVRELKWGDVEGWTSRGGAELGISRHVPTVKDLYAIGRGLEQHRVDALLIIGGWDAFEAAHTLNSERERYPAFQIPMICLPATIDNNIPDSELSVGADSALNLIVDSIDRVRQAGTASSAASWSRPWAAAAATWRCSAGCPAARCGCTCTRRASRCRTCRTTSSGWWTASGPASGCS